MSITKEIFGKGKNGETVYVYTMDNKNGLRAKVLTWGGIIKNLYVTHEGKEYDVVLGRETMEDYLDNEGYLGAAIGRHANRIKDSQFIINGVVYKVGANEDGNSLHGGFVGFDSKNWTAEEAGTDEEPALILSLFSADGEEGFPGNMNIKMTYTLSKENGFVIRYEATSDKDTVMNMTNHSYFNLNGHDAGSIYEHILQINGGFYSPNTIESLPCGEVLSVKGTPMDFTEPKTIGRDIKMDFDQLNMFGGYDNNFAVSGNGFRLAATLTGDKSGIVMETYTDKPAIQLYTGNHINERKNAPCKGNVVYKIHDAVCLETQYFPNSTSYSHYPSAFLKKDEKYDFTTEYRFITK